MMNKPIERYQTMASNIADAIRRTEEFQAVVTEIESDPFVAGVSQKVEDAAAKVYEARIALAHAAEILAELAPKITPEAPTNTAARPSVGTVVDDSVRDA